MTPPDKPDTADVPTETRRDERAVATAAPEASSTPAESAESTVERREPAPAESAAQPPAKSAGKSAPAESAPAKSAQAKSTPAESAEERPAEGLESARTVVTSPVEGPEVTSSAPPPWQRVPSDAQQVSEQRTEAAEGSPSEATTRITEWGYQRSPRSSAYTETTAGAADPLGGVVSGTAASSVFASAAGQSGVRADARPNSDPSGRATVSFNAPPTTSFRVPTPPPTGSATPSALRRPGRGPRRASLQIRRVDPWSVLKLAFVLSVALFFVWLVAVGVLYGVLDGMGVWDRVNGTYNEFAQNSSGGSSGPLITASRVFGIAAIIGAINIVLFTALATVGSFVYNVSADLAGGLEITLAERE